jgi:hypothetical protein
MFPFLGLFFFSLTFMLLNEIAFMSLLLHVCAQAQPNILHSTATLSDPRYSLAAASSNELVFFGGGMSAITMGPTDRVDIYNVASGIWTTAILSIPRYYLAATSSGNLVFFAGGWNSSVIFDEVDIYNTSAGSWSTATLSQSRWALAATSVGNLVFFGGGFNASNGFSDVVDIYNVTSNAWTNSTLSQARGYLTSVSAANRYAFFAGGLFRNVYSSLIDVYDTMSGEWSTLSLSVARDNLASASFQDLVVFAGGETAVGCSNVSNVVDMYNVTSKIFNTSTLSVARCNLAAAVTTLTQGFIFIGGGGTNQAVFDIVDVYNLVNDTWFTLTLSQPRFLLSATSSGNQIFFGGGFYPSVNIFDTVDIFIIQFPPSNAVYLPPSKANHSSLIPVILAIIGAVVILTIAIVVIIFLNKRKKKKSRKLQKKLSISELRKETVVIDNTVYIPSESETTISNYQPGTETLKSLTPGQIPLNELEIGKEIGQGTYGRVCVGKWKKYQVALKFCQNKGKMDDFMREANLMISLPPHPNIVRMYGVSIDGTQPIIVMEYCAGGSLDTLLFDENKPITNEQKFGWVNEIARGMLHLHKHNIVHRDLAARNILLSRPYPNGQPKISDFGMSRVLQQDIESKTLNIIGPIRWMAPESIGHQVYSKKSDVWMFGILIYEIIAQREPHVGIEPNEVLVLIRDNAMTPPIPSDCPQKLRELMQMCWKKNPEQRPSFEMICEFLASL